MSEAAWAKFTRHRQFDEILRHSFPPCVPKNLVSKADQLIRVMKCSKRLVFNLNCLLEITFLSPVYIFQSNFFVF